MPYNVKSIYRFISDEFLDTFGREFCKHEVLWKPNPSMNKVETQMATHLAHQKLAQALNLSLETILTLLETFPAACLDLMSRYEARSRSGDGCGAPDWLTPLARHFGLHKNSAKCNESEEPAREDLVRALCESARAGVGLAEGGAEDGTSPLRGPRAVAHFVARHRLKEEQVLPAWLGVLRLCVVKLCAVSCAGDRARCVPAALRPSPPERALADLALLHDAGVSQIEVSTPAKLRMLVLLFRLVVAATDEYEEERRRRRHERDAGDDPDGRSGPGEGGELRTDDGADAANSAIDVPHEPPDSGIGTSARNSVSYTVAKALKSLQYEEPRSLRNLLREEVVNCEPRRDATAEGRPENGLHTELDLEPDVHFIAGDTGDYEISSRCVEIYSKNNIGTPSFRAENRAEDSSRNIVEKSDARSTLLRESNIASKSQNSHTGSEYPTRYRYEESKSNSSEEQRAVWASVYTDFIKRGRTVSLISLQHRWVELLHRARVALLTAWSSETPASKNVHPLLLVVAHRFPEIVTDGLSPWKTLVAERRIVLDSDIKDIVLKYLENDNVRLNITENLNYTDLIKEYVINKDSNDPYCQPTSHIQQENNNTVIDNIVKDSERESQAHYSAINNDLDGNHGISTVLDQIDPSKATVSIILDEDSDEAEDENTMNVPHTQNCKNLTEITMKNIDNLIYTNNTEFNENINDSNELLEDNQAVTNGFQSHEELSLLKPRNVIDQKLVNISRVVVTPIEHLPEWKKHSRNGVIKCRNFSVRNFTKPVTLDSKELSKCTPYTSTINTNKNGEEHHYENIMKNEVRIKFEDDSFETEFDFEDDNFETDFDFEDDINNGITYQKYIELYGLSDHLRKTRIKLTKKLKLSRTYYSSKFWSLDGNIELMKLCKPVTIRLNKSLPRVAKRVELSDITEVRRMNKSILTAEVSPTLDTHHAAPTPPVPRSSAPQETINTKRRTNNSLSSALDSSELLKLLTNYAIRRTISQSVTEPVRNDITCYGSLMDSILDTMRLRNQNTIHNSTSNSTFNSSLQRSVSPEMLIDSCNTNYDINIPATDTFNTNNDTNIPATDTFNTNNDTNILATDTFNTNNDTNIPATDTFSTLQTCDEEVRSNNKLNSINNSLLDTNVSQIHISSNHTKELYTKNLQKTINTSNTSDLEETRKPTASDLKHMILLLVKDFDNKMRHEYNMKCNRSSLNLHLKNFEKQQRALVKDISKLTKILPQYVLNNKSKRRVTKNATAAKKPKKTKRIKCKQSKEQSTSSKRHADDITDTYNTSPLFIDEDCEPNLVIDETILEPSDHIDFNNSKNNKISTPEKNIVSSKDKKEKKIRKTRKKSKQSEKISEEEKSTLNEYQEWQRQKTMALKYFTLPMSDTTIPALKDKIQQRPLTSTSTEQQTSGCQTNISMKRTNTADVATSTASDNMKRPKLNTNESNVVCISDDSDDDVLITGCYDAGDAGPSNSNKTRPGIHQVDETEKQNKIICFNDDRNQTNRAVINTPVVAVAPPVYVIINETDASTAPRDATSTALDTETINNPILLQALSNVTFPTLPQEVPQNDPQQTPIAIGDVSERVSPSDTLSCQRTSNQQCECIECQNTLRPDDVLAYSVDAVQNATFRDLYSIGSRNDEPSTSALKQNKQAITAEDYLSRNKKPTALIKVHGSQNLLVFCSKYLILTDVNIPSPDATYRTTVKNENYKLLCQVLLPTDRKGNVLLLGSKNESDYINCQCLNGSRVKCNLCHKINNLPKNILKINKQFYKKVCWNPIKYVRLNRNEMLTNSRVVLEGNPDLILVSQKFYKKLTDSPPTYARILSALPDAATLRHLVYRKVVLYAFDVTQTHYDHRPVVYSQTNRQVTVYHPDDKLVRVLQWFLNDDGL